MNGRSSADGSGTSAPPPELDIVPPEIMESFLTESGEILESLGQDLVTLEARPSDRELLNTVFRAVHTLKGTSSFLGFSTLTETAHALEDLLNAFRRHESGPRHFELLLEAYDALGILVSDIRERRSFPRDTDELVQRLRSAAGSVAEAVDPDRQMPDLPGRTGPGAASGESTIRVQVTRLDALMNLVGELVLGRNRLMQAVSRIVQEDPHSDIAREAAETGALLDYVTTEIQRAVMKTRMVPVAKLTARLPRLVRDLSRDLGKDIDLRISGEETELDKSVIEVLADPLIHLIRNAADHAIEPAEERVALGKPAKGSVSVSARNEGNHVVLEIGDDGRGMDPAALKAKGIELGLVPPETAEAWTDRECFSLVFAPGFSTAREVTNVSGRGVGMDVVRTNITQLKGTIDIRSTVGAGTTFVITVPLTLAIVQALLVDSHGETYALPLEAVREVVRVRSDEVATVNGGMVLRLRDTVLPVVALSEIFDSPTPGSDEPWTSIVVVQWLEHRIGIRVDRFLAQKEIVLKPLGDYLSNVTGVAGSTILGDGRAVVVLDIGGIVGQSRRDRSNRTRP